MRADRRQPPRLDDPAEVLVAAGLIDAEYVSAQLGTTFDTDREAAEAVVVAGDVSPHPLFEASWLGRRKAGQRTPHPVLWYVGERRRRNRLAPHPLVEPRVIFAAHPEARLHEYGPLSYWLSVATPETPLPTRLLPRRVTWGTYRAAAIRSATSWREEVVRRRPVPVQPSGTVPETTGTPAVTVVVLVQDEGPLLRETVESLQAQTFADWELVAVDRGSVDDSVPVLTGLAAFDGRITVVREDRTTPGAAGNAALEHGTGDHVAFLAPGRAWAPDQLATLLAHARERGLAGVHAAAGGSARNRDELLAGRPVDLTTMLLRRDAIKDVGGFDESLDAAADRDLVLRLSRAHDLEAIDLPVARRADTPPSTPSDDWDSFVLERQLVDWEGAGTRELDGDLVSYVVPLGAEPRRTVEWFSTVPPSGAELVAVGVRLRRAHHMLAQTLAAVVDGARFVPVAADVNASAAANVGMSRVAGGTTVLVRPEVMPPRLTLSVLLTEALAEPGVALVQTLVLGLDGTVLSAGARFAATHAHPALLLEGHPAADARRLGRCAVSAPASPLVALHTSTAIALRGLNARFRSVLAETDLGLRAHAAGLGRTVLVPEAVVTSRRAYAEPEELVEALACLARDRVAPPPDTTAELLARAGFEVTDQRSRRVDPEGSTEPVLVPEAVVRAIDGIHESPPRLRWALDIAAPAAARGDKWGDTFFARSLADALERHGQHVAVDRRDARDRDSRDHDDVLLVLRGLDRVTPRPGLLNLQWVISHPDMVTPAEVAGFDAVYAASLSWSDRVSRDWGVTVTPLLQCTDARWFHPDRAEPDTGPPVVFVGNSRGVYRFAVRSALAVGVPLALHGKDWAEFVPRERITSNGVANEEVGALYASAGVVLNDHHRDMRRDGFASNRLFDAAACGARILSDSIDGIEQIFGGLVQTFGDENELARLVEPPYEQFPDHSTRREIALRIVAEHSFDRRAETLVDDAVRRLLARRG